LSESLFQISGVLVFVFGVAAVSFLAYHFYPSLESKYQKYLKEYVGWVVTTREHMFRPVVARKVELIIFTSTGLGLLLGFYVAHGYGWITLVFTLVFGVIGWSIPRFWVELAWQQRVRLFDGQLVDALHLMANSLKSGLNLPQVIQVLVEEMPNPISQEFGMVLSQQKIGLTIDEALEKMLDRMPSEDLAVAVHSVLILRETGGNLAETFEVIAGTIRERRKVDGKIRAMTMQGKMQGTILFLMPFGLAAVLYYSNPGFLDPLFSTQLGWMMILVMLIFQTLGGLWIKKIITIDI
jgi:tight adherence protein B